ncbi:outer dynein arm light chain 8 [Reticulomyxa filosa]|uniref:Dynein light chain n=1 Tax=Reticulomyxa filosa TaxID=46433 RepID=X6LVS9_RETFI|nr:outer dynein arm light chain 8 [Reticulomyxa filosa]|eukprot:ETO04815.1 outer dynein arm light chain 8 [Reticulomyxa filosa]
MSQDTKKAVVKIADMSTEMQVDAVASATAVAYFLGLFFVALEKLTIEKDVAAHIKKEFDKKHGPTWHCVVGRNFGSYVTHETKHFIYFYIDQVAILLFNFFLSFESRNKNPPKNTICAFSFETVVWGFGRCLKKPIKVVAKLCFFFFFVLFGCKKNDERYG